MIQIAMTIQEVGDSIIILKDPLTKKRNQNESEKDKPKSQRRYFQHLRQSKD